MNTTILSLHNRVVIETLYIYHSITVLSLKRFIMKDVPCDTSLTT